MIRFVPLFLVAAATLAIGTEFATAAEKSHNGLVVSVAAGKLVMTDNAGKNEHSHMIGTTAKVTVDGKAAKLTDLKAGDKIKVTQDDAGKVIAVAANRTPR
jgi:hypothetical protein